MIVCLIMIVAWVFQNFYTTIGCVFTFSSFIICHVKKIFFKKKGLYVKHRPVEKCTWCEGFGFNKCILCKGKGTVFYEKKYLHYDPCPKCLEKRYTVCVFCKGLGEKRRRQ